MNPIIDLKDDYNRELRRRWHLKVAAWWFRSLAAIMLLMGFGALIALAHQPAFTIASVAILIAGIWGQHYLATRH